MSINFLLQATRIIHIGNYDDTEIRMIYDFLRNLDNSSLNDYFVTYTILSYNNDLELYVEVLDKMIKILETEEEYEKCDILLNKKKESEDIMNINVNNYESTRHVR